MSERGVNRLAVVGDDRLVGVLPGTELVRASARPDGDFEREIVDDVRTHAPWVERGTVDVKVARGPVTLGGTLRSRCDAELLGVLAARVRRVVSVESNVAREIDDARTTTSRRAGRTLR